MWPNWHHIYISHVLYNFLDNKLCVSTYMLDARKLTYAEYLGA